MVNRIKQQMIEKQSVLGPFLKLPSPAVVEIAGLAGFDFVIIDCEHGPLNILAAEDMVRAAKLSGISPVIRISDNDASMISRALDIGADAVQVPQISTREDAEKVVRAAKFFPLGERGVCRFVRAAEYSAMDRQLYFKKANEETLVIIHVEGYEGVNNIDEILEVEGIDVVFLGPYDLSQSLGIPGEVDNPKVIALMEKVIEKAKRKNKFIGTFADTVENGKKWLDTGVQYLSYSVDVGIIMDSFKKVIADLSSDK